jgi:hypothetical protein
MASARVKRVLSAAAALLIFFSIHGARISRAQISLPGIGDKNPLGGVEEKAEQELFVKTAAKLLDDQLPVNLDATKVLPTVDTLPGGPFAPQPLVLTPNNLASPLPPGDYTMNVMAFCTEYSVHRPGQGVAYELAPLEGRLATPVATLLWRGVQGGVDPRHLMSVAWGIQSGLRYEQMPKTFQATIDGLIPEYEPQLEGDFLEQLEDAYNTAAKKTKLPPLDALLAEMGDAGRLALEAEAMQRTLLAQSTTDEEREQTLFAGQENGVYAPVKAEEGPWTVRVPGVAYMRYVIMGGNLASNNVIQIRILPQPASQASAGAGGQVAGSRQARLVKAGYAQASADAGDQDTPDGAQGPSVLALFGAQQAANSAIVAAGMIGYSMGQAAQALIAQPPPLQPPPLPQPCTPGDAGEVQFIQRQQVQPNWCWAAAAEMIMEHANPGAALHQQCEQVQILFSQSKKLAPNAVCGTQGDAGFQESVKTSWDTGGDAYTSITGYYHYSISRDTPKFSSTILQPLQGFNPDVIKSEISCMGRLLGFTWTLPTPGIMGTLGAFSGAHDMIIYGYGTDAATGDFLLKLYNPGIAPQSVQGSTGNAPAVGNTPGQSGENTPVQCMNSATCVITYANFISPTPFSLQQVFFGASKP